MLWMERNESIFLSVSRIGQQLETILTFDWDPRFFPRLKFDLSLKGFFYTSFKIEFEMASVMSNEKIYFSIVLI